MADELTLLSKEDIRILKGIVEQVRTTSRSTPNRPAVIEPDPPGEECYIALIPDGGISVTTAVTGTGTGTDSLGYADCQIYRRLEGNLYPVIGMTRRVYSLRTGGVAEWTFVIVKKDSFGTWWIVDDEGDDPVAFSGARVYNTTNQTITTGTYTAITFNSERFDTDAFHSTASNTSRFTVPSTGYYLIGGTVQFYNGGVVLDTEMLVAVRLNGATYIASQGAPGDTATTAVQLFAQEITIATVYYLTAGDYVELMVKHEKGSNLDIQASGNFSPEFWITELNGGSGGSGTGDVVGPASATDNAIARFDGTTGKLIQNSTATVDDSGNLTIGGGASASELRLLEPSGGGASYTGFKPPALAANVIYTLPVAMPAVSGYVMSCTTAGVMSWAAQSGGGSIAAWSVMVNNTGAAAAATDTELTEFQQLTPAEGMYVLGWNADVPPELCVFDVAEIADLFTGVIGQYRKATATKTEADFTAAATSETIDISITLPSGARVLHVDIKSNIAWSGGGSITAAFDVGTTGTPTLWITAFNGFAAVSDTNGAVALISTFAAVVPGPSATVAVKLKLTSNVNVSAFTAGSITITVHYMD